MKKVLLLALLVVGCNPTEPEDCAGVAGGTSVVDAIAKCGGSCVADADADGLCDALQGTVTDIDGNTYKTIIIGTQIWMAENLKTTKYKDGSNISTGHSDSDWSNLTTGAYALLKYYFHLYI
jgi:hypothetical protein